MADDSVLPFDFTDYANDVYVRLQKIRSDFSSLTLDWSSLENSIQFFNQSAMAINKGKPKKKKIFSFDNFLGRTFFC